MAQRKTSVIDCNIGQRVKIARYQRKITQQQLGDMVGVTFQQIQKYENGKDRIPSSRLYEISHHLNTPIGWFFRHIGTP